LSATKNELVLGEVFKQNRYTFSTLLIALLVLFFTSSAWKSSSAKTHNVESTILPAPMPSPYFSFIKNYHSFIEAEIDTTGNVGAAVAIVCGDSLLFIQPYGVKSAGTTDSVNVNTIFRLASVSKGFAGVLAAKMEAEGKLDLDANVKSYLPGIRLKDSFSTDSLTIKHTLNHTSGLVPHAYDNLIEAHVPMSEIIDRLNVVDIAAKPGEVYGYQNVMYSMIDTILQVKTGNTYSSLLNTELFKPLGMNSASADFESLSDSCNLALPHVYTKKGAAALKPNKRYYNMAPAAGVNASISDMGEWLMALLGNRTGVLDENTLKSITTPTVQTPLRRKYYWRWKGVEEKYYSLGWRIYTYRGYDIIYHGGYVKGYRAEISFCPELNAGVVFLQNSPNRLSSESMPVFWDMYFNEFVENKTDSTLFARTVNSK